MAMCRKGTMHQNMVMNELPILVLVEIYQISGKD